MSSSPTPADEIETPMHSGTVIPSVHPGQTVDFPLTNSSNDNTETKSNSNRSSASPTPSPNDVNATTEPPTTMVALQPQKDIGGVAQRSYPFLFAAPQSQSIYFPENENFRKAKERRMAKQKKESKNIKNTFKISEKDQYDLDTVLQSLGEPKEGKKAKKAGQAKSSVVEGKTAKKASKKDIDKKDSTANNSSEDTKPSNSSDEEEEVAVNGIDTASNNSNLNKKAPIKVSHSMEPVFSHDLDTSRNLVIVNNDSELGSPGELRRQISKSTENLTFTKVTGKKKWKKKPATSEENSGAKFNNGSTAQSNGYYEGRRSINSGYNLRSRGQNNERSQESSRSSSMSVSSTSNGSTAAAAIGTTGGKPFNNSYAVEATKRETTPPSMQSVPAPQQQQQGPPVTSKVNDLDLASDFPPLDTESPSPPVSGVNLISPQTSSSAVAAPSSSSHLKTSPPPRSAATSNNANTTTTTAPAAANPPPKWPALRASDPPAVIENNKTIESTSSSSYSSVGASSSASSSTSDMSPTTAAACDDGKHGGPPDITLAAASADAAAGVAADVSDSEVAVKSSLPDIAAQAPLKGADSSNCSGESTPPMASAADIECISAAAAHPVAAAAAAAAAATSSAASQNDACSSVNGRDLSSRNSNASFFIDTDANVEIVLTEEEYNRHREPGAAPVVILGKGEHPMEDWTQPSSGIEFGFDLNEDLLMSGPGGPTPPVQFMQPTAAAAALPQPLAAAAPPLIHQPIVLPTPLMVDGAIVSFRPNI